MSRRRTGRIPFANDPCRGPPLSISRELITPLSDESHLSTALVDFLLQRSLSKDLSDDMLIGCANALSFFESMNKKKADSSDRSEAKTVRALRHDYSEYSRGRFQFVAANCCNRHFFVIKVVFDARSPPIFHEVCVYDSLRRTGRRNEAVNKNSLGAHFLRQLQQFLSKYSFHGIAINDGLIDNPDYILQSATYTSCPHQDNMHDCTLFALATVLHIVELRDIDPMMFSQAEIDSFRSDLYMLLSYSDGGGGAGEGELVLPKEDPKQNLSRTFICSYFPHLAPAPEVSQEDPFVRYVMRQRVKRGSTRNPRLTPSTPDDVEDLSMPITSKDDYDDDYISCQSGESSLRLSGESSPSAASTGGGASIVEDTGVEAGDDQESSPPAVSTGGKVEDKVFMSLFCATQDDETIRFYSMSDVDKQVDKYEEISGLRIKVSKSVSGLARLYICASHKGCCFRAKFGKIHTDGHVERIFVCPGIMKRNMKYVRPVMSLDAAHLRSAWGGILYVASVKTGCDEIYPVAFAIMNGNENQVSWQWFLEQLRCSIDILVMDHPRSRVDRFKYFSFMSDRQKGLIPALSHVFPDNHCCHCAIHIARNSEQYVGKRGAKTVYDLSSTFSHRIAMELMTKIEQRSPAGRVYLDEIPAEQWRGTAWIDDHTLPPRYGIYTTNMSESTNSMLEAARDSTWLECIDIVIKKMMERIVVLREKHKGKHGLVEKWKGILEKRWENCAGFKILRIQEDRSLFSITRQGREMTEPANITYTIDTVNEICDCGKWQEHGVPCIDAMAYYKLHEKHTLSYIMENLVDKQYTCGYVSELLRTNIVPVCLDTISRDGVTLPPEGTTKRRSGRPKVVRLRKRSKWAHEPGDKSNVVCSRCKKRGHNVRTCLVREELGLRNLNKSQEPVDGTHRQDGHSDANEAHLDLS